MNFQSINIYTGIWTNWSRGPVYGATITLTQGNGNILTAILAVYVTMVGHGFWRILRFALHQCRAMHAKDLNDGLHIQTQAILRNTGTATDAIWELGRLGFYWKNRNPSPMLRGFAVAAPAILIVAGFGVATIFSTQVTKSVPSTVLIQGEKCGYWYMKLVDNDEYITNLQNYTTVAANYARACYGNGTFGEGGQCKVLPSQEILFKREDRKSCPFQNLCNSFAPSVLFDTDEQDTSRILGINAPDKDRVLVRRRTECAVLNITQYCNKTIKPDKGFGFNETYQECKLGEVYYLGNTTNYTYQWNTHAKATSQRYDLE